MSHGPTFLKSLRPERVSLTYQPSNSHSHPLFLPGQFAILALVASCNDAPKLSPLSDTSPAAHQSTRERPADRRNPKFNLHPPPFLAGPIPGTWTFASPHRAAFSSVFVLTLRQATHTVHPRQASPAFWCPECHRLGARIHRIPTKPPYLFRTFLFTFEAYLPPPESVIRSAAKR